MHENSKSSIDALILCGGLGTRFHLVRDDIPKALAPIQGIPFIDLLLNDLVIQGYQRIILATGYMSEKIALHLKNRKDAEFIISQEEKNLGTGGAIKNAENHFKTNNVLVLNGDSRVNISFSELISFHNRYEADFTMLLSSETAGVDYGNVELSKEKLIIGFREKPVQSSSLLINAGIYCLNRTILEHLQHGVLYSLEKDLIPSWIHTHQIYGMVTKQAVYDIGTVERYKAAQKMLFIESK